MAQNKKIPKAIRIYAIVTQYAVFLFFLTFVGYYFGSKLDSSQNIDSFYSAIFGVIGIVIGISLLIYNVLRLKDGKR